MLRCCISGLLLLIFASTAFSADRFAIIYPQISGPYKAIFQTILKGIRSRETADFLLFPVDKDVDLEPLRTRLIEAKVNGIIALGKRGYLTSEQLNMPVPTVVGALPLIPDGSSGISLSSDPEQLFARLKSLVPDSKQVFVVYSPQNTGWLLPYAKQAAQKHKLSLEALPAKDIRETMQLYRQLLDKSEGRSTAIWLPLDKLTTNDDIVLPFLLQEAWDKNLVICSSKPAHVQRGALFSLYPDYYGLGEELVDKLIRLQKKGTNGVIPLGRLHMAVNLRTAAHLGLNFSGRQQQTFNLTFPSP